MQVIQAPTIPFFAKSPSLLQFDKSTRHSEDSVLIDNLKRLYWLLNVPSDFQIRSILDEVSPANLRPAFRAVHSMVQRGQMLEYFKVFGGKLVVSTDGTGLLSSTKVHCSQCGM